MRLKELAAIQTGLVLARARLEKPDNEQLTFTLSSVTQQGIKRNEFNKVEVAGKVNEKYLSCDGDLLIRLSSPNYTALITKENENVLVPSQFALIRLNNDSIIPAYLQIYLNSDYMVKLMSKLSEGTVIRVLSVAQIGELDISIPPLQEQKKIVQLYSLIREQRELKTKLADVEQKRNKYFIEKLLKGETL
jgi:restriction endonuclease S subunit